MGTNVKQTGNLHKNIMYPDQVRIKKRKRKRRDLEFPHKGISQITERVSSARVARKGQRHEGRSMMAAHMLGRGAVLEEGLSRRQVRKVEKVLQKAH